MKEGESSQKESVDIFRRHFRLLQECPEYNEKYQKEKSDFNIVKEVKKHDEDAESQNISEC